MATMAETPRPREFARLTFRHAWGLFNGGFNRFGQILLVLTTIGVPTAIFAGLDRWPLGFGIGAGVFVLVCFAVGSYRTWADSVVQHTEDLSAHRQTQAELAALKARPVSEAHRDRLLKIVDGLTNAVESHGHATYLDERTLDQQYAESMIAEHFPELIPVVDEWNDRIKTSREAETALNAEWASVVRHQLGHPWMFLQLEQAFEQYLFVCRRTELSSPRIPEPSPIFQINTGGGTDALCWVIGEGGYLLRPDDTAGRLEVYKDSLTKVFEEFRSSQPFNELRVTWSTLLAERDGVVDKLFAIKLPEHVYGKCLACQPDMAAEVE